MNNLIVDIITEKEHRFIFDRKYVQRRIKYTLYDKFRFWVYETILYRNKGFRSRLKLKQTLLKRAYRINILSTKGLILYSFFRDKNYQRYS